MTAIATQVLAQNLLEHLGGAANVKDVRYCSTRLRFRLKKTASADSLSLKALEDLLNLSVALPYQEEKDVEKYEGEVRHYMKMTAGMAYVCFPWAAHRAVFHFDEPLTFTKAVIKLAVEERKNNDRTTAANKN
ncbi:YhcH/YjgK/YiaL family protein [Streptococcus chenjunshii]|uniref:DUF386 family protein n=1 Tax=Streptococcus chenjunshii TaxID=2173853 RepID=A0A372KLJ6_9STRE|nr:YhcH/YjgK/YiaL family protein [Streptococcus chenjunshii]RFU53155.1 DUF386 family protein [Streptococcus chenjunshii]